MARPVIPLSRHSLAFPESLWVALCRTSAECLSGSVNDYIVARLAEAVRDGGYCPSCSQGVESCVCGT